MNDAIAAPSSVPDLSGKTALVTGASRGIGYATAKTLAAAGAQVVALARTVGGLEELDDEIRAIKTARGPAPETILIPADLTDAESMAALPGALAERFGKLDILVANAGALGELAPIPDISEKAWREVFNVNVDANWRLLRLLDPLLRASGGARIAALTSRVGGAEPRAFWGAYAASKAALEMLFKTYAEELRNTPHRVAIIDPGAMRTKMRAAAMPGEDPAALPDPGRPCAINPARRFARI